MSGLNRGAIVVLVAMLSTTRAGAQDAKQPDSPGGPMAPPGPAAILPTDPHGLLPAMHGELNLDEAQTSAISRLVEANSKKIAEIREAVQRRAEQTGDVRAILDELRAARATGDTEQIKALTDRLRQMRKEQDAHFAPLRRQLVTAREELRGQILEVLRPEQKEGFERIWRDRVAHTVRYGGRYASPQALKNIVDRLPDLAAEQRRVLDQIFRQFFEADRNRPVADDGRVDPVRERLVRRLYDGVMNALTPEQRRKVSEKLNGRSDSGRPRRSGDSSSQPADDPRGDSGQSR